LSYQIVPNIIFILAVLAILLLIVRRLPEAASAQEQETQEATSHEKLLAKGLPAIAFSKFKTIFKFWIRKIWNFVLEAKDLKPQAAAGYRMKKMFSHAQPPSRPAVSYSAPPITTPEVKNEQYYLEMIKLEPKNLSNYDTLGKFYLDQGQMEDAKDIYKYLVNHQPGNPEYWARLGYCYYILKNFDKAAANYQKSLALDSTQPNRYYNLGLSWEGAGNFGEAVKSFETAIALEPTIKYYISLSNVYLRINSGIKAREALRKAQTLDPQNDL
jgi:tetratricopeptide (TPR) repeat protein